MKTMSQIRAAFGVVVIAAGLSWSPIALSVEKILQNDSFTGAGQVACQVGSEEGEILAARFTPDPGDHPFTVEKIQVLICPDGIPGAFTMTVWQDDGVSLLPVDVLYQDFFPMTGSDIFLNEVDLSAENIVIDSGTIRVGFDLFQDPDPSLATEPPGQPITPAMNFVFVPPNSWFYLEQFGAAGDWIIRVVVDANEQPPVFVDGFESGDAGAWSDVLP